MIETHRIVQIGGVLILVVLMSSILFLIPGETLTQIAEEHRMVGAILFGLLMFVTTVIAPFTSLPLIPVIAPLLGPFTTGLASYGGWMLGALVAFSIARSYGQPVVEKFIPRSTIEKYESYMRPEMTFFFLTILHLVIPVDVFGYMLGMFTHISLGLYMSSAALGILWFSFALAYMGDAFMQGDYVLLSSISVASVLIFLGASYFIQKTMRKN